MLVKFKYIGSDLPAFGLKNGEIYSIGVNRTGQKKRTVMWCRDFPEKNTKVLYRHEYESLEAMEKEWQKV